MHLPVGKLHEHADEILKATLEEIELGLARPLESKEEVDAIFGRGGWHPLPCHMIFQDGKPRAIDDAKAGGQNEASYNA